MIYRLRNVPGIAASRAAQGDSDPDGNPAGDARAVAAKRLVPVIPRRLGQQDRAPFRRVAYGCDPAERGQG
ncbi:hypothetical protein ACFYO5_22710 [Streptomyces sp. NPDC006259]|uniref:hypothetical protein n=1 Tax=Streptomyces sp. NPDC006259 TaxID=3364740 RepID=UPI003677BFA7